MNQKALIWCAVLAAVVLHLVSQPGGTAFGQASVPFSFSPNTAAKASEVNENFQALVNAVNGLGTPIPADGSYRGMQFAGGTAAQPNVVVMVGQDRYSLDTMYAVRVAYTGTPAGLVNGTGYAYIRELTFVRVSSVGDTLGGFSIRQGTDSLNATAVWDAEVYGVVPATMGTPLALSGPSVRSYDYRCYTPATSGRLRHCRVEVTQAGMPSRYEDDSRVETVFAEAFSVGGMTFPDGGLAGATLSKANARDAYVIARGVGMVVETRMWGTIPSGALAGNDNPIATFAQYVRIGGVVQPGAVLPPYFATGDGAGVLF